MAVNLRSGAISRAEALLRWRKPGSGLLLPSAFMPDRPDAALARRLTHWVVMRALKDVSAWKAEGPAPLRICINVTADEVADGSLLALARELASHEQVFFDFEIALSGDADEDGAMAETNSILTGLGFGVTLAPAGAAARLMPLQQAAAIKATRVLIGRPALRAQGVRDALAQFSALGMTISAQHVESAADLRLAADLGCDEAQGRYIAEPVPASELMAGRA